MIRTWKDYNRVDADTSAVIADPALAVPLLWEGNPKRYGVDCRLLRQVHSPLQRIAASGLHPCRRVQACACESACLVMCGLNGHPQACQTADSRPQTPDRRLQTPCVLSLVCELLESASAVRCPQGTALEAATDRKTINSIL